MRSFKLQILLIIFLSIFVTPTEAFAVIQNLNGQTGQTQTFQNDSNLAISSSGNVHSLGWLGLLPVSRGGTGAGSFTAGSVLFSNGTSFAQNNSNLFWDNTNNRLGIGTASPSGQLHLGGTGQAITNNYGLLIDDKTAGTQNFNIWSGPPLSAFDSRVQSNWSEQPGINVFTSIDRPEQGDQTGVFLSQGGGPNALTSIAYGTGDESWATAGNFFANSLASEGQTAPHLFGLFIRATNDGAGSVTEMADIAVQSNQNNGGGVVENNFGIKLESQGVGVNNFSIWTNQGSGTNNYALYTAGDAKSYFGGNVGIKTQNPDAPLDVVGSIKGDSTIILGNSTTPACIEAADSDGSGVSYITINDGVISASTTKPSFCQ